MGQICPLTCPLKRKYSTVCRNLREEKTLVGQGFQVLLRAKRVMGIEPTLSAWKADNAPCQWYSISTKSVIYQRF